MKYAFVGFAVAFVILWIFQLSDQWWDDRPVTTQELHYLTIVLGLTIVVGVFFMVGKMEALVERMRDKK